MNTKNYIQLSSLFAVIAVLASTPATAATNIYANNASALNINMLTNSFLSYTHNGERLSDLFVHKKLYGSMTRIDEYGDDGTTLPSDYVEEDNSRYLMKNIWIDVNHINGHTHYDNNSSTKNRFNLVTVGATSQSINLTYGDISFGLFGGYINSDSSYATANGDTGGIFAHYNLNNFTATVLADIGSMNNNSNDIDFNNSWTNVAMDANIKFDIDNTFIIQPGLSIAYTFVSSDDLYVNNNIVWSKDFNFLNLAPGIDFIKEIAPNWFGALSAKYIAHFGGKNDIYIANIKQDGTDTDNHIDLGLDIEHDFKRFTLSGNIHKQIGGFDGWSGNILVKYAF